MTRLTTNHIQHIEKSWQSYEEEIKAKTGFSLFGVACSALDLDEKFARSAVEKNKLAIIPLSQGEGYISGFVESLKSIADHLGFTSSIFSPDNKGFSEFQNSDYELCIWANDDEYFVENKNKSIRVNNNEATGKGFAEILHLILKKACQNLEKRVEQKHNANGEKIDLCHVIVRGCGSIGICAAEHLASRNYHISLYDSKHENADFLSENLAKRNVSVKTLIENDFPVQLNNIRVLLDAAPNPAQSDAFGEYNFDYIVAPCVPCLWDKTKSVLWHDPLQLGTAVMLVAAAARQYK